MNLFNEYDIIKDIPHILLGNKSDLISEINENLMNDFAKSNIVLIIVNKIISIKMLISITFLYFKTFNF